MQMGCVGALIRGYKNNAEDNDRILNNGAFEFRGPCAALGATS